jgi:hypothetical protein
MEASAPNDATFNSEATSLVNTAKATVTEILRASRELAANDKAVDYVHVLVKVGAIEVKVVVMGQTRTTFPPADNNTIIDEVEFEGADAEPVEYELVEDDDDEDDD